MQKLWLLQEMPIIKSAASPQKIHQKMNLLLSQTTFTTSKEKKNFIISVRQQVEALADLMRELSGNFDYRSTLVQFLAAIFVLVSLIAKIFVGDPANGIFGKLLGL